MRKYVRVTAEPVDPRNDAPYNFDLVIDDETGTILSTDWVFGFQGPRAKATWSYPFLLEDDGRIDFGLEFEVLKGGRYYRTDLLEKRVKLTTIIRVWSDGPPPKDAPSYRIINIQDKLDEITA